MKEKLIKSAKFSILGVMAITLTSKFLGFVKELVLAYFFGVSEISDAYLISQTIPGTLFQLVGTGITTCFVPIYLAKKAENREEALKFVDKFLSMVLCVSAALTLIVLIFTRGIVRIFAMGFDAQTMRLAEIFTRISVSSLVISAFVYVLTAFLNAEKKFFSTAVSVIPYNLGLICAIWVGAEFHLYAISYVSVLAIVLQMIYLMISAKRCGYGFVPSFRWAKDKDIRQSLMLLPPVILGVAATEINTLIDRTLASVLLVGGITIISYGTSLFNLLVGVFAQSVSTVYYPSIAEAAAAKDNDAVSKHVKKALEFLLFMMIPLTAGVFVVSDELVNVCFRHGSFNADDARLLSGVLILYSLGIVAYGIRQVISNAFYSLRMTKQPMINTVVGIVINIGANFLFGYFWGIKGLALATSLSTAVICVLLIISLRKVLKQSFLPSIKTVIMYLVSAGIMFAACFAIDYFWKVSDLISLIVIAVAGVAVYMILTWILGINPILSKKKAKS